MKVGQEDYIHQWDYAAGDVITDISNTLMDDLERAVITHISADSAGRGRNNGTLCWVEWVDRPMRHQANGSFRPATQLFLEVVK